MLVVYLALELLRDAVGEFIVVFNPLSSLCVLDGHGRNACSRQQVGLNEARGLSLGCGEGGGEVTQTPERTYDCGPHLLHQLDGGFHCAAGLNPLVN